MSAAYKFNIYNEFVNLQRSEFKEIFDIKGGIYGNEVISPLISSKLPQEFLYKTIFNLVFLFQILNKHTLHFPLNSLIIKNL